jgi:hypothetical protein
MILHIKTEGLEPVPEISTSDITYYKMPFSYNGNNIGYTETNKQNVTSWYLGTIENNKFQHKLTISKGVTRWQKQK